MSIMVSKIQRMCFDDGPGIRTTVFLKGCSISCPWCSNPECIQFGKEYEYDKSRCKEYDADTLVKELLRDQPFWGDDGGVTFSGGEALLQTNELVKAWKMLKEKGIHLTIETALFVPLEAVKKALEYIDLFYVDIKILEPQGCKNILGGNIATYMKNIEYLANHKANIIFRIPCAVEYVLQKENWRLICEFLEKYKQYKVELFAIHDLGKKKYEMLGMNYQEFEKIPKERLEVYMQELQKISCEVSMIQI